MPHARREFVYPSRDSKPIAESDAHFDVFADVRTRLKAWAAARGNVYAGGGLLVYYEEGNPKARLAPDCFVTFGVPNNDRDTFKTWVEGTFPRVVIEFTSRSTRKADTVTKFAVYQDVWRVAEYFLFDPLEEYLRPSLRGYSLVAGRFVPIICEGGKLYCAELGLLLSRDGTRIRLDDAKTGRELPLRMDMRATKAEAENARLKAELAALRKKRSG